MKHKMFCYASVLLLNIEQIRRTTRGDPFRGGYSNHII